MNKRLAQLKIKICVYLITENLMKGQSNSSIISMVINNMLKL